MRARRHQFLAQGGAPIRSPGLTRGVKRLPRKQVETTTRPATATRSSALHNLLSRGLLNVHPSGWRSAGTTCKAQRFPPEPGEHPWPRNSIVQTESLPTEFAGEIFGRASSGMVFSAMQRRNAAVVQPELKVTSRDDRPRSEEMSSFVRETLRVMGNDLVMLRRNLHWSGMYTGSATAEMWWEPMTWGAYVGYSAPTIVDHDHYHITWRYAPPGQSVDPGDVNPVPALYARRPDGHHVPMPPRRAIRFTPWSRVEPYGRDAPLERVYWAAALERLAYIDWSFLVQRYGEDPLVGKLGEDDTDRDGAALAGEAAGLGDKGFAMLLQDESLDRIGTAVASGSADIGSYTHELQVIQMAAILSGGLDSSGMGKSGGSNARAKSGDKVARPVTLVDMELQAKVLERQLAWRIVAETFGEPIANEHSPYVSIDQWDPEEWELYQEGLERLLNQGGKVTPETAHKLFIQGEPPPDDAKLFAADKEPETLPPDLKEFTTANDIDPADAPVEAQRANRIAVVSRRKTK